jgi:methionyl-tRNA formyltransferase
MRVAFFGTTLFSCAVLKGLLASQHEIVAVVTQPDQPAGRRMELCPTPVCGEALSTDLPVLKPERIRNNREFRRELTSLRPEAFMVASFGQIISPKALALTEHPLNVHPSALPRLRGASPVRSTLLQGLTETQCCIMRMTQRMDDGDILLRGDLTVDPHWNFAQLCAAMSPVASRLAIEALDQVSDGTAQYEPQDHSQATFCTLYGRDDTWIDWRRPAAELCNFIRAWDPDIGALALLPDGQRLKIWQARIEPPPEEPGRPLSDGPGTVLAVSKKAAWVATGDGALRLMEVQPPGKSRMPMASFLAGHELSAGQRLGSQPAS